jgi:hypothetical protein
LHFYIYSAHWLIDSALHVMLPAGLVTHPVSSFLDAFFARGSLLTIAGAGMVFANNR